MTGPIWTPTPEAIAGSRLTAFARYCADAEGDPSLTEDAALARFALDRAAAFWTHLLAWSGVPTSGSATPALEGADVETARFFPALRLSYAEALLAGADDAPALVSLTEDQPAVRLSRGELRARVRAVAAGLAARGVGEGDRVVAIARNHADTAVAALAVAALGASWSAVGPDMAAEAALTRFRPLAPTILLAHGRWHHQGADRDLSPLVTAVAAGLGDVEVVPLDGLPEAAPDPGGWTRRPFDHPLCILFSSGTTGAPKCIVHGQGGTLLEHVKELALHVDLGPDDVLYFHTSAAWMMWNWQLSALATGASIVLYDGAVAWPEPDALLTLLAAEGVTWFGTSPPYLQYLEQGGVAPPEWPSLRGLMSTGSILYDSQYHFVRRAFGDLPLQSVSGGTDIVGCFVLGHPHRPVWPGECSSITLGYDVQVAIDGAAHRAGTGELVCTAPFPSRPVGLYRDPEGERFHGAYFADHAGMWTHGDLLTLSDRGTARMLGRCDGILNVQGVRIGPAEIYGVVRDFPEIAEAMAVDQAHERAIGGRRLVLLLVMADGETLERRLILQLKKALRDRRSRAHVPQVVVAVDALPATLTGKRSERAASDALNGRAVRNRAALANPMSLDAIRAAVASG